MKFSCVLGALALCVSLISGCGERDNDAPNHGVRQGPHRGYPQGYRPRSGGRPYRVDPNARRRPYEPGRRPTLPPSREFGHPIVRSVTVGRALSGGFRLGTQNYTYANVCFQVNGSQLQMGTCTSGSFGRTIESMTLRVYPPAVPNVYAVRRLDVMRSGTMIGQIEVHTTLSARGGLQRTYQLTSFCSSASERAGCR